MRVLASLLLAVTLLFSLACQRRVAETPQDGQAVWFAHATDPHLYYDDEKDKNVRLHQEKLNQAAFSDLIRGLGAVPGLESKPSFLLVTGDLGLDRFGRVTVPPAPTAPPVVKEPEKLEKEVVTPAERESAVSLLAETLKGSPVKDIYFVLGNNDVANEAPSGPDLDVTSAFLGDVQKRIAGSGVVLHDLTSCYRDPAHLPSGCSFDVPGTDFRLIGFSSFSFKNDKETYAANQPVQEAQMQQLATLVDQARAQGKKALIVTHIPEIDDPYPLGKFRWRAEPPAKSHRPDWAAFSPWNVSPAVYQSWKEIVDSGNVAGVLAGHFHDSHKEIYYRPYRWATSPSERADVRKLFLAPPLSVRFQDTSPVQARGFTLFRLRGDGVWRNFYWYEPESRTFKPDAPLPKLVPASDPNPISQAIAWLWQVVLVKPDLARAVVIAIAFLAAFLTVVQLWEIPPTQSRLASPGAAPDPPAAQPATALSTLTNNFAKTVLAGLGGMLVLDFLGSVWNLQEINGKAYYILIFVIVFFLILFLYAGLQSAIEALRSRIATRQQPVLPNSKLSRRHGGSLNGVQYWLHRIWRWLLSLRSVTLIFLDTFFNVIRGRNQLRTKIFEDTIIDLHRSIVRAAERIRDEVDAAVVRALHRLKAKGHEALAGADIRVNITVLSEDESMLYYLSRERGSLPVPFEKHSVAWISVYTGEARWFKSPYLARKDEIVLLNNAPPRYPALQPIKLTLGSYYQTRLAPDYKAFLVLPFPTWQRGMGAGARRGAIQISFRNQEYLDALWDQLDQAEAPHDPDYERASQLLAPAASGSLGIRDEELGVVLHESLEVLGELLRSFNDAVFEEYIKPNLQPAA